MKLSELLEFNRIVIQCHDNPDADAIASGYGLYLYFKEQGKDVSLVYGGRTAVRKSNLVIMIDELKIPIVHCHSIEDVDLLITVDCQYGEGNVSHFDAKEIAIIDHHRVSSSDLPKRNEIRSTLGSCATLVWSMLKDEGFDVNANSKLATALYYGLYTDTNSFTEIYHPLDKDMRDETIFDNVAITKFRNANISLEELETAGAALLRSDYVEDYRFAIVKANKCDPNVLGLISDLVLEVDMVDTCLVFCPQPNGVKFSVRSCIKEVKASELAREISKGVGSGGGHLVKAGGFLQRELLITEYRKACKKKGVTPRMTYDEEGREELPTSSAIKGFLEKRMMNYFKGTQIIHAEREDLDFSGFASYLQRSLPRGYVKGTDIVPAGTSITLRALEGDLQAVIEEDTYITINAKGDIFLGKESGKEIQYRIYPEWNYTISNSEYNPIIKKNQTGETISLLDYAKVCVPVKETKVLAKCLDHKVKLFTKWDKNQYLLGKKGDYITIRHRNLDDIMIFGSKDFQSAFVLEEEKDKLEKVRAVVFDMDGTLLDTLEDLQLAVNYALEKFHLPEKTLEEVRTFLGNGVRKLMERSVEGGAKHPQFEEIFTCFTDYYNEHCNDHTKPYKDVLNLMKELSARGIKMAIVSNKLDSAVKVLNEKYFGEYVSVAVGDQEGVEKKPSREMVDIALKELGVSQEHAIYVGDSEVDLETARNAGLECVSVTWGFRDIEFLKEKKATIFADVPMEILSIL